VEKMKNGSANGNRTRFGPVQFGSVGSTSVQVRSSGTTRPAKDALQVPDVVTRESLAGKMIGSAIAFAS